MLGGFEVIVEVGDLAGEKVEAGHDGPVGAQLVLGHDLFVVEGGADVVVGGVGQEGDGRVGVDQLGEDPAVDEVVLQGLVRVPTRRWSCRCRPSRSRLGRVPVV